MANPDDVRTTDDIKLGDLFRPLIGRGQLVLRGTLIATLLVVLVAGAYLVLQPAIKSASLEFRPIFEGANIYTYPNGTPFAGSDIVSASIVDQVFARNRLQEYCELNSFRSALYVRANSPTLQFLTADYGARLSDPRLGPLDRTRLEGEYAERRARIPLQYELMFIQSPDCDRIPQPIVVKALGEVLETWATESQDERGVMKLRVAILSPGIFDQPEASSENLLVRSDLLRTAVGRVIANITEVETLPGSELVRGSDKNISLTEVRAELEDLIQARLDPLVAQAGQGLGREAGRWVGQALQTSTIRYQAAQQRAEAYRSALREYSGMTTTPTGTVRAPSEKPSSSDVQTLTPQIDRTFIDRIVELSSPNMTFRQEITREAIAASVEAVTRGAIVEQYRQLSVTEAGNDSIPREVVSKTLAQVAHQAKEATRRFNEIYEEFSRVALRPGPAMFRVEKPVETYVIRSFGTRELILLVLAVMLATPILLALGVLLQYHVRRFVHSVR